MDCSNGILNILLGQLNENECSTYVRPKQRNFFCQIKTFKMASLKGKVLGAHISYCHVSKKYMKQQRHFALEEREQTILYKQEPIKDASVFSTDIVSAHTHHL